MTLPVSQFQVYLWYHIMKVVNQSSLDKLRRKFSQIVVEKGIEYTINAIRKQNLDSTFPSPSPYMFIGGKESDYEVEIGKSGISMQGKIIS